MKIIEIEPLSQTFTSEKMKVTLIFYWNILWRCLLFAIPFGVFVYLSELFIDPLSHNLFLGILGLISLVITPLIAYVHYNVVVSKNFGHYDKVHAGEQFLKFWSWDFWSIFIKFCGFLIMNYCVVLAIVIILSSFIDITGSFGKDVLLTIFLTLMSLLNKLLGYHIFLHKGLWGFILVSKKPAKAKKNKI